MLAKSDAIAMLQLTSYKCQGITQGSSRNQEKEATIIVTQTLVIVFGVQSMIPGKETNTRWFPHYTLVITLHQIIMIGAIEVDAELTPTM